MTRTERSASTLQRLIQLSATGLQRWKEAKQHTRRDGHRNRVQDNDSVRPNVEKVPVSFIVHAVEAYKQAACPEGNQPSQSTADRSKQQALREELAQNASAPSPECTSHRNFGSTCRSACEQKSAQICAYD